MFNLTEDQFKMMFICPSHRHNLGLRPCQYSLNLGPVRKCTGRDVFNVSLSKAVFTLYGKLIQVGSRKYYATFTSSSVVISNLGTVHYLYPRGGGGEILMSYTKIS